MGRSSMEITREEPQVVAPAAVRPADPSVAFLRVKRLSEHAVLPKRASKGAAGYDLVSAYDYTVAAGGKELVKTDLSIDVPSDCYVRVAPRSGLALKRMIATGAGVVDSDYRGNVGVILFNHGPDAFSVKRGDRIAQMILERIYTPEVEEVAELEDTNRGAGGFGSTGKRKLDEA